MQTSNKALFIGFVASLLGALVFAANYFLYDTLGGPICGYQLALYPGNLSLKYIWHPLFTEEINFWPKLALLLLGQWLISSVSAFVILALTSPKTKKANGC